MADWRSGGDGPVTLSVLDRLLDDDPKSNAEPALTRAQSLRILKAGLRRDIEWLLNTRVPVDPPPETAEQLQRSLYNYGLPDLQSLDLSGTAGYQKLARLMETAIANFEPRLAGVKVRMSEGTSERRHIARFVIEGLLRIDPAPEFVAFDTALELTSGEYEVKGEQVAG